MVDKRDNKLITNVYKNRFFSIMAKLGTTSYVIDQTLATMIWMSVQQYDWNELTFLHGTQLNKYIRESISTSKLISLAYTIVVTKERINRQMSESYSVNTDFNSNTDSYSDKFTLLILGLVSQYIELLFIMHEYNWKVLGIPESEEKIKEYYTIVQNLSESIRVDHNKLFDLQGQLKQWIYLPTEATDHQMTLFGIKLDEILEICMNILNHKEGVPYTDLIEKMILNLKKDPSPGSPSVLSGVQINKNNWWLDPKLLLNTDLIKFGSLMDLYPPVNSLTSWYEGDKFHGFLNSENSDLYLGLILSASTDFRWIRGLNTMNDGKINKLLTLIKSADLKNLENKLIRIGKDSLIESKIKSLKRVVVSDAINTLEDMQSSFINPNVETLDNIKDRLEITHAEFKNIWVSILCDIVKMRNTVGDSKTNEQSKSNYARIDIPTLVSYLNTRLRLYYNDLKTIDEIMNDSLFIIKTIVEAHDSITLETGYVLQRGVKKRFKTWMLTIELEEIRSKLNYAYYKKPLKEQPLDLLWEPVNNEHDTNLLNETITYGRILSINSYLQKYENLTTFSNTIYKKNRTLFSREVSLISSFYQKVGYTIDTNILKGLCDIGSYLCKLDYETIIGESKIDYHRGMFGSSEQNIDKFKRTCFLLSEAFWYSLGNSKDLFYMLTQRDFRGREYYIGSMSPTDFKIMRILLNFPKSETTNQTDKRVSDKFMDYWSTFCETWNYPLKQLYNFEVPVTSDAYNVLLYWHNYITLAYIASDKACEQKNKFMEDTGLEMDQILRHNRPISDIVNLVITYSTTHRILPTSKTDNQTFWRNMRFKDPLWGWKRAMMGKTSLWSFGEPNKGFNHTLLGDVNNLVELDASSSALQMIAVTFKNYELIEKCGFNNKHCYIDPYEGLIPLNYEDLTTFLNTQYKTVRTSEMMNRDKIYEYFISIYKVIENRKVRKNAIMTIAYGAKPHNVAQKTLEIMRPFYKKWFEEVGTDADKRHISWNISKTAALYLYDRLMTYIGFEMKVMTTISRSSKLIRQLLNKPSYISNSYIYQELGYSKIAKKRKKLNIKGQNMYITSSYETNEPDLRKETISSLANFMHMNDAYILTKVKSDMSLVIKELRWGGLLCVHDAFIVPFMLVPKLIEIYQNTVNELLFSDTIKVISENMSQNLKQIKTLPIQTKSLTTNRKKQKVYGVSNNDMIETDLLLLEWEAIMKELDDRANYIKKHKIEMGGAFLLTP